ncbi:hypothetical protein [Halobiforma nitratireducens]|nr:hypothetical protein [Halobiforma nitratireducens]
MDVARICADLAIVADLEKKLLLRQSPFAKSMGQAVQESVQQGIQQLQQQGTDIPEVQRAISEAQLAIEEIGSEISQRTGQFEQQGNWQFQQRGQQGQYGQSQQ